jgi:retron-type reverse transcriptase
MRYSVLVRAVAASIFAGEPSVDKIASRLARTLGQSWPWLRPLVLRYLRVFPASTRPSRRDVICFLANDRKLRRARSKHREQFTIVEWLNESQRMRPVPAASTWDIPPIHSVGALADWLEISVNDLLWFADLKGLASKLDRSLLEHYHYRVLPKPSGVRLIEIPKPRLKDLQRQILSGILEKIPPHPSAHGFLKNRSIKTFVTPHVGQRVVLRLDLQDFFPTFPAARIAAFFRVAGYPDAVADLLAGLCTNVAPRTLWAKLKPSVARDHLHEARDLYQRPHLPQGAPTSPSLANLCTYRVDCRLSGLAQSAGAQYTRYADDLAFSGENTVARHVDRFSMHVAAILMEEGFRVNHRKTRVMRRGVRQHLAGLVTNQKMNVLRADFDRLKAILTNCVRHGADAENRESHSMFRAHLEGRVAFVESIAPARGARLRMIFEQIQWPASAPRDVGGESF